MSANGDAPVERPRLVLKPRDPEAAKKLEAERHAKSNNPFGAAKPREAVLAVRTGKSEEEILKEAVRHERPKLRLNAQQLEEKQQAEALVDEAKQALADADDSSRKALETELQTRQAALDQLLDGFEKLALEAALRGEVQRPSERKAAHEGQQGQAGSHEGGRGGYQRNFESGQQGRGGYDRGGRGGFDREGGRGGFDREGGRGDRSFGDKPYNNRDRDDKPFGTERREGGYREGGRGGGYSRDNNNPRSFGDRDGSQPYSGGQRSYDRGGRGGYDRAEGGGRGGYERDGGRGGYERDGGRGGYERDGGRGGYEREGGRGGSSYTREERTFERAGSGEPRTGGSRDRGNRSYDAPAPSGGEGGYHRGGESGGRGGYERAEGGRGGYEGGRGGYNREGGRGGRGRGGRDREHFDSYQNYPGMGPPIDYQSPYSQDRF